MNLNKSQKKYLKKNLKRLSLTEISQNLQVSENDLLDYLKSIWPADKFQKFKEANPKDLLPVQKKPLPNLNIKGDLPAFLRKNSVYLFFLVFLVVVVYCNSLKNEFLSDDIAGIMQDKNMGNILYYLENQPINFFRYFFYSIIYKIFGLNPLFFRLLNIFWHLGVVWIIYTLVSFLNNSTLALIVASIFAVHPILTEGVVWITGGIHAQYSFFVLLSFWLYLLAKSRQWSKKLYLASLASFFAALFTTEKSAVLPLILLSFELLFGQIKKDWKKIIPYFGLGAIAVLLVFFGGNFGKRVYLLQTQYYQERGYYNPLTQIPTAISSYLSLIFWPDKLTLYHSEMNFTPIQFLFMFSVTSIYFGLIVYFFFKKKYKDYLFWLIFFLISLLPMLTPFKVAWIVAERYIYLGCLGIFMIVGLLIEKIGDFAKNQKIIYIILAILLVVLSGRTIIRNVDWKNQDNLWLAAARTSPSSPQNHNNLGDLYGRHGNYEKAAEEFLIAIQLKPDYGDAYHNLANTYRQMGKNDLALANYQKAVTFNPSLWQSYQNLTVLYYEQGKFETALEMIGKATQINPENPDLYFISGIILVQLNQKSKAKEAFQKVISLNPDHEKAKEFLSNLEI